MKNMSKSIMLVSLMAIALITASTMGADINKSADFKLTSPLAIIPNWFNKTKNVDISSTTHELEFVINHVVGGRISYIPIKDLNKYGYSGIYNTELVNYTQIKDAQVYYNATYHLSPVVPYYRENNTWRYKEYGWIYYLNFVIKDKDYNPYSSSKRGFYFCLNTWVVSSIDYVNIGSDREIVLTLFLYNAINYLSSQNRIKFSYLDTYSNSYTLNSGETVSEVANWTVSVKNTVSIHYMYHNDTTGFVQLSFQEIPELINTQGNIVKKYNNPEKTETIDVNPRFSKAFFEQYSSLGIDLKNNQEFPPIQVINLNYVHRDFATDIKDLHLTFKGYDTTSNGTGSGGNSNTGSGGNSNTGSGNNGSNFPKLPMTKSGKESSLLISGLIGIGMMVGDAYIYRKYP